VNLYLGAPGPARGVDQPFIAGTPTVADAEAVHDPQLVGAGAGGCNRWIFRLDGDIQNLFLLPAAALQTSLAYGWITSSVGVVASIICALLIDKVGRKPWYSIAFLVATVPLLTLSWLGATSAIEVLILATGAYAVLQTIAFSLYLYSAELYPTRLRAVGTGFGSAWLRAGSSIGPLLVGWIVADLGIRYVFAAFSAVALVGGLVTLLFAIETKGSVLEELSP
jgi:MFS transporter, putative metabolite:H+ symporter